MTTTPVGPTKIGPPSSMSRRRLLQFGGLTAAVPFLGGALAACGSAEGRTSAETLSFTSWKLTGPSAPVVGEFIEEMEAIFVADHEGSSIDATGIAIDAYADKLIALFGTGGDAPDIIHLPGRNLAQFARAGWLEPLDDYPGMSDYLESFVDLQSTACVIDGKVYGVLTEPYCCGLAYNADLFAAAGLEPPTQPDELLTVAKALTTSDGNQFGLALPAAGGADTVISVTFFLIGFGTHWTDQDGNPRADSDAVVEAVSFYRELLDAGVSPRGVASLPDAGQLLYESKAAMSIDGPWVVGGAVGTAAEGSITAAPVPFAKGVGGGVSSVLTLPKGAATNDVAWDFITTWASDEGQTAYSTAVGSIPPNVANFTGELAQERAFLQTFVDQLPTAVDRTPRGFEANYNEFAQVVSPALEAIFAGQQDVAAGLRGLQESLEKMREEQ